MNELFEKTILLFFLPKNLNSLINRFNLVLIAIKELFIW